jgi:hypothetical protein
MLDPMRADHTQRWQAALRKALTTNAAARVRRLDYGLYQVPSATRGGVVYTIAGTAHDGSDHACDCRAGTLGQPCYHVASVTLRRQREDTLRAWRQTWRQHQATGLAQQAQEVGA